MSFRKFIFGIKFLYVSLKLKKIDKINKWFLYRKKWLLSLKLDKYIKINNGQFEEKADIYFLNHQSFVEILFIPYIIKSNQIIGVVKKELQENWTSKGFTKFDIGINRNDPKSAISIIRNIIKYKNENVKIVIYPEGTRNNTNEVLLPFKKNLGKLLSKKELNIQPIIIKKLKNFIKGKTNQIEIEYLRIYNTKENNWYKNIETEMKNRLN